MVEDKITFVRVGLFYACFCRDGAIVTSWVLHEEKWWRIKSVQWISREEVIWNLSCCFFEFLKNYEKVPNILNLAY